MKNYKDIDEYIKTFPAERQIVLQKIREIIKSEVPEAEEAIRYGMPTFRLNGKNLIHFAAFKNHYGIYPTPNVITEFKKELYEYTTSKGAIQFPIDKPVPYDLIKNIIVFRIKNKIE